MITRRKRFIYKQLFLVSRHIVSITITLEQLQNVYCEYNVLIITNKKKNKYAIFISC